MSLKYVMDDVSSLPEDVQKLYSQNDQGKYVLTGISGVVAKERLDEFRNTNIELKKQVEKIPSLQQEIEEYKIKLQDKGKDVEEVAKELAESRIKRYKSETQQTIETLQSELESARNNIHSLMINSEVSSAATSAKVLPTAMVDVMLRAKNTFKVKDGQLVAVEVKDGKEQIVYGSDGVSPLSVSEWMKGLKKSSPHLFESSNGAGIHGSRGSGPTGSTKGMTPLQKISAGLN